MQYSDKLNLVLIENPLTGNDSFGRALKLERTLPKWSLPKDCRLTMTHEKWSKATKVLLVRDPAERFATGATLALSGEGPVEENETDGWRKLLTRLRNESSQLSQDALALEILRHMQRGWFPTYLRPQVNWMGQKTDLLLATHDIATYFNVTQTGCALKSNCYATDAVRSPKAVPTSTDTLDLLRKVYAKDYDALAKLPLWSPVKGKVRFLSGFCTTCPVQSVDVDSNLNERANVVVVAEPEKTE